MPRSSSLAGRLVWKDPRIVIRVVLGTLVALNIIAALVLWKPWGGSPEDLARDEHALRQQVSQMQARLNQSRQVVAKVEQARQAGDKFLGEYTMDRRAMSSLILAELDKAAKEAGM